jgi:hypothetical protein
VDRKLRRMGEKLCAKSVVMQLGIRRAKAEGGREKKERLKVN